MNVKALSRAASASFRPGTYHNHLLRTAPTSEAIPFILARIPRGGNGGVGAINCKNARIDKSSVRVFHHARRFRAGARIRLQASTRKNGTLISETAARARRSSREEVSPTEAFPGEAVSGRSYAQLHQRLQDLIAQGTKVADATAGTPAAEVYHWINLAYYCLSLLEDKIPTAVSDFRRIRQSLDFKVDDDEEAISKSAYMPEGTDVLLDFRFDQLAKANNILKFAATKLEMEGYSLPTLGEELRAARQRAGHSQREAGKKIGYDHKHISEWETGKRKPHPQEAKNIRDYILLYPENK